LKTLAGAGSTTIGFVVERFGLSPAFYVAALVFVLTAIRMFILKPELIPARRN